MMLLVLCLSATWVAAQDPVPPQVGLTARCHFPGTVTLTWTAMPDGAAVVLRAEPGGEPVEIARLEPGAAHFHDTGLAAGARHEYTVTGEDGQTLGPVRGENSPEMLPGGDFEDEPPGPLTSTLTFRRAYLPPWWEIVQMARPGSTGTRSLQINHATPPRRDGLHSRLIPLDPRGAYRQSGWQRVLPGSSARIGRQLLNAELGVAGGRIVAYSYAPVILAAEDGWQYAEQRLHGLPADTAYLQVWALAFETGNTVWFDDLSLVDETTERLFGYAPEEMLPELLALARGVGDAELLERAETLAVTIRHGYAALANPGPTPVGEYLDAVFALDEAVRDATDLAWDLRILGLAD